MTYVAVITGIVIIAFSIFIVYSNEQGTVRGQIFGEELQIIQEDLKKLTHTFDSKVSMLKDGSLTREEFLELTRNHIGEMEELILQYDTLSVPKSFVSSVKLFKLSSESQLESDKQMIEWVDTGDDTKRVRSDELLQDSFEYEMAALAKYKSAQGQLNP